MTVAGLGGRKLSLAGIVAYHPGHQPRIIYRPVVHRGRKGEPKGFGEDHFAGLLDAAHQHLGAPIVLLWDGLPAHKSAKMRALIAARPWLRVYRLPGYAPELNPVENMWSSLKRSMANLAPGGIDDLLRVAKNRLKRMQYRPVLAFGFLATSGLAPP
ncbi:putative transposase [Actinoplanes xinjiangensis]|uniref:Putative transposase n=1 Tax=Actinoplanes xinjiangensis TaxID=512350 RepID=A0A316E7W5_9ACTN|nr:putative transposase [Actinoplanes xinjiangensis]